MTSRLTFPDSEAERLSASREPVRAALLAWFRSNARPLPWRKDKNPYRIWISEIILQQTRVDQAIPYFHAFLLAFPTVQALADASVDDVLKRWEGLGYYSRARNLHRAARAVVERFGGKIPSERAALLSLPGIGPYTAAAILSIAFGQPYGVLDGNAIRVLTRLATYGEDVQTTTSRRTLQAMIDDLVDPEDPGAFNEAVMELGATICTPGRPDCESCPICAFCAAAKSDPQAYPVRARGKRVPHYDIAVAVLRNVKGEFYAQRRPDEGLLGGLWEFPGGKREPGETVEAACRREIREELGIDVEVGPRLARIDHAYSHFRITLHAFDCRMLSGPPTENRPQPWKWIAAERLEDYAFPRANRRLIEMLAGNDSEAGGRTVLDREGGSGADGPPSGNVPGEPPES